MVDTDDIETFERAFRDGVSSCRGTCACGREFYNSSGGWDFDEGEIEALEADPNATATEYAVGYVTFEGVTYLDVCACWHPRAAKIRDFLRAHDSKIAAFLTEERARKQSEFERAPVVGGQHG